MMTMMMMMMMMMMNVDAQCDKFATALS